MWKLYNWVKKKEPFMMTRCLFDSSETVSHPPQTSGK
uniref:Uncharacterized protein n=1 Tax=Anguilla anguilla TaxID=7936 RepID=A0A0E9S6N7_ANGAN